MLTWWEIGRCHGHPLSRFAGLPPIQGGENMPLYASPRSQVARYTASIVPPLQRGGEGGGAATKGGAPFPSPVRAAPWFYYKRRPYFPKGAYHGLCPLSEATQPLARATAQGHTHLCAEGAGPYGNTAAPPTGIYCHWQYLLSVPRSFADAQYDSGRRSPDPRSRSSIPAAPRLHACHHPLNPLHLLHLLNPSRQSRPFYFFHRQIPCTLL